MAIAQRVIPTNRVSRNCSVFPWRSNALARTKRMKAGSASRFAVVIAAVIAWSGCASTRVASPDHLRRDIAAAELAYRELRAKSYARIQHGAQFDRARCRSDNARGIAQ